MKNPKSMKIVFAALLLATAFGAGAQSSAIRGRVVDSTGTALPGVTVEARTAGWPAFVEVTGSDGTYRFAVPPATYDVSFTLINFASSTRRGVTVAADGEAGADATLFLSASATVVVTAPDTFREPATFEDDVSRFAGSASAGVVTASEIARRPMQRPGDVLETVPGLSVSQHSGEGKANQYYLRGFNLDHGTDVAVTVAGVPLNLPTHAHGHGYSDANFLIPELLSGVSYRKGPYDAEAGDFASAGTVNITYLNALDQPVALLEAGAFGHARALVAASPEVAGGNLLYALEWAGADGPWEQPNDHRKLNGVLRYARGDQRNAFSVTAMAYRARWNATDQIPARAVASGEVGRFGTIDETDGGRTGRYVLTGEWQRSAANRVTQASAYALGYELNLFSNFTYFLDDPVNGDQFEQSERRLAFGTRVNHRWLSSWRGVELETVAGAQARHDLIDDIGLHHTKAQTRLATIRQDDVRQTLAGVYLQSSAQWLPSLRTTLGLRADDYRVDVRSELAGNGGTGGAALLSPKLGVILSPFRATELFLNAGSGFHSNDARGATTRIDPATGEPVRPADPLVRTRGAEVGLRTRAVPRLHATAALWMLDIDSELLFVGDAGTTDASRPSRRRGVELTAEYALNEWFTLDGEYAWSRARFADDDPAGNRIPGSVDGVASLGLALSDWRKMSGELRFRYLGPRPLIEDDTVRSEASNLVSARLGYALTPQIQLNLDIFNLLGAEASDIDYYYQSRLPGEPAEGVSDTHFHPIEPRSVRVSVRTSF